MVDLPLEQRDVLIRFAQKRVPELMRQGERTQRAHGVYKKGMRAVERINVSSSVAKPRPARRLHRAAHLKRQLAEVLIRSAGPKPAFAKKAQQIAVRADDIESVVVDAHVRDVARHVFEGIPPAVFQKPSVVRGIELQQRRSKHEPLCPLRPAARSVLSLHGEDRSPLLGIPRALQGTDLLPRKLEETFHFRFERIRNQ